LIKKDLKKKNLSHQLIARLIIIATTKEPYTLIKDWNTQKENATQH